MVEYDQNFCNRIASLSYKTFKSLPKTGKPTANEWTVMSSIIKEHSGSFEVVALGTGSKCIGKNSMSSKGDILNDSHAEVICRRGFLRYLYHEIDLSYENQSDILKKIDGINKCRLKNDTKFHFFTTHVPCGDAAIFLKQSTDDFGDCLIEKTVDVSTDSNIFEESTSSCIDSGAKRKNEFESPVVAKRVKLCLEADVFRTGAKCLPDETKQDPHLQGKNYHTIGAVRTKPGRGDPTLSVSCSDKIAKWSFVGVQGSLLSLLLDEPIYFNTFTISGNTPFCETALLRAVYDRFDDVDLIFPYKQHKFAVGQAVEGFECSKTESKQPCPSSIVWCKLNNRPLEISVEGQKQGVTKKNKNTKNGRLQICKIELFRLLIHFLHKNNIKLFDEDLISIKYGYVKQLAKDYYDAWSTVQQKCFKIWSCKDRSLLHFSLD